MPRKANNKYPPGLRLANGRWVYRPYIPNDQRHIFTTDGEGYLKPPIRLGSATEPYHRILAAYAASVEQHQYQHDPDYLTLNWLLKQYQQSNLYRDLAAETRKRYTKCEKILLHPLEVDGTASTLGQLRANQLKTTLVRRILDKRLTDYQAKGKDGASQCNNEKALLSSMYRYGIQYVDELANKPNPCHGISKFKVTTRDRYVTDDEYTIQYQYAIEHSQPYLPILMELTYLLASRGIESTELVVGDANERGILVDRRKGSKSTRIRWSDSLRAAWDAALALHTKPPTPDTPLLKLTRGKGGLTKRAVDSAWQKLKQDMEKDGLGDVYFQLHDLKRKGISDAKDDRIAGHISDTIRARYNVKVQEFDPPR